MQCAGVKGRRKERTSLCSATSLTSPPPSFSIRRKSCFMVSWFVTETVSLSVPSISGSKHTCERKHWMVSGCVVRWWCKWGWTAHTPGNNTPALDYEIDMQSECTHARPVQRSDLAIKLLLTSTSDWTVCKSSEVGSAKINNISRLTGCVRGQVVRTKLILLLFGCY